MAPEIGKNDDTKESPGERHNADKQGDNASPFRQWLAAHWVKVIFDREKVYHTGIIQYLTRVGDFKLGEPVAIGDMKLEPYPFGGSVIK